MRLTSMRFAFSIMRHETFCWKSAIALAGDGVQPNVLQLYGLGEELPERIDLWFRAHSYVADDRIVKLAPHRGAKVQFYDTTLTVREIQRGYRGWSSAGWGLPRRWRILRQFWNGDCV